MWNDRRYLLATALFVLAGMALAWGSAALDEGPVPGTTREGSAREGAVILSNRGSGDLSVRVTAVSPGEDVTVTDRFDLSPREREEMELLLGTAGGRWTVHTEWTYRASGTNALHTREFYFSASTCGSDERVNLLIEGTYVTRVGISTTYTVSCEQA